MLVNCKPCLQDFHEQCHHNCLCEDGNHNNELEKREEENSLVIELKQMVFKEQQRKTELVNLRGGFFIELLHHRIKTDKNKMKLINQFLSRLSELRTRKLQLFFLCGDMKNIRINMTDAEFECWEKCHNAIKLMNCVQYGVEN